jgi:hypothetical protein
MPYIIRGVDIGTALQEHLHKNGALVDCKHQRRLSLGTKKSAHDELDSAVK